VAPSVDFLTGLMVDFLNSNGRSAAELSAFQPPILNRLGLS